MQEEMFENLMKENNEIMKQKLKLAPKKTDSFPTYVDRQDTQINYLMMASRKSMQFQQRDEFDVEENIGICKEEKDAPKEPWDEDKCIIDVIERESKCKKFTNFEFRDLNELFDYATYNCSFDINMKWITKNQQIHSLTKPFGKSKIPAKFVFFLMLYQLKHAQTFSYLYGRMKLERFCEAKKDSSKT